MTFKRVEQYIFNPKHVTKQGLLTWETSQFHGTDRVLQYI